MTSSVVVTPLPRSRTSLSNGFVLGVVVIGALTLLWFSEPYYPMSEWLVWHYAAIWLLALVFTAASLALGDRLLTRVFRLNLSTYERIAIAYPLGVLGFEMLVFLLGVAQGYGTVAFAALPIACLAWGGRSLGNLACKLRRQYRVSRRLKPLQLLAVAFGIAVIALIAFEIMTPYNVQFDSRWKHMALAEDYVAHGGLRRTAEGWVFSSRPHFTSYAYAWAFMLPAGQLFHRMLLCAHMELLGFLVTTWFALPALVRRLVPNADVRVVWVTRFLFPGVLLYDSSLSAGADHFGAFFAPAIALVAWRAWRKLEPKLVVLLALLLAGACMVKETVAIMVALPPMLAMLGRMAWLAGRALRGRIPRPERKAVYLAPLLALGVGLVATAPFWLKNFLWYGDPVYPTLFSIFPSHPWSADAAYRLQHGYTEVNMWAPDPNWKGLASSTSALFDFSFIPNDWKKFHGNRPVFGSLFTILWPCLLVFPKMRRSWALVAWSESAIFIWYWVHHQDRYLQALMPLMAAVVAAVLITTFRELSRITRVAVAALVGVQLLVGADVYFIATHAMTGSAVRRVVDLLGMGHKGKYEERFEIEHKFTALDKALPKYARILFHEQQSHLGSARESVQDTPLWQFGIEYGKQETPKDMQALMEWLGVTHIYINPGKSLAMDSLAGDFMFFDYVYNRTKKIREIDGERIAEVPDHYRGGKFNDQVVLMDCKKSISAGRYRVRDLRQPPFGPLNKRAPKPIESTENPDVALEWMLDSGFLGLESHCHVPRQVESRFRKVAERPRKGPIVAYDLWIRL